MGQKQLAIRMNKLYDIQDGSAEKYEILAYFKEQEKARQNFLNSAVGVSDTQQIPLSLSQRIALGIVDNQPQSVAKRESPIIAPSDGDCQQPFVSRAHTKRMPVCEFCFIDLMLCIIAFLLFLNLILR